MKQTLIILTFLLSISYNVSAQEGDHNVGLTKVHDTTFVNILAYSSDFVFDMKYATKENFLKEKVYDCDECYLRYKTVKALLKASKLAAKKGFRIKLFDCYRPVSVQRRMWAIVPNPVYVADPAKGSIHNRGGAVDLTLVDENGQEPDMGTPFDFFGPEASHSYDGFSDEIKGNRKMLRSIMRKSGFSALDSEWWHYNLKGASRHTVSNFNWDCQ